MENKPSTIVLINVIFLLLYIKFGTLFLWVIAVAGLTGIFFLAVSMTIMRTCTPSFYSQKFSPFCKKTLGYDPPEFPELKLPKRAKLNRRGLIVLAVAIVSFILLIYTVIKEAMKLF